MARIEDFTEVKGFNRAEDRMIERKKLGRVLEAGRNAPSPGKRQTLEFVVVEDDGVRENISKLLGDKRVSNAPTSVVVLSDPERMGRIMDNPLEACYAEVSGAAQNMRVMASSEGLCSNMVTSFNSRKMGKIIDAPDRKRPLGVVSFAYSDDPVESVDRFGMNKMCFYDKYGAQLDSVFDEWSWSGLRDEKSKYKRILTRLKDKFEHMMPKRL